MTPDAGTPAGNFDVVVANIVSGTLIECAAAIAGHSKAGGKLLLSGILEQQVAEVVRAYDRRVVFEPPVLRDGWAGLTGRRA